MNQNQHLKLQESKSKKFKYLDKLPLFNGSIYRLINKKAKRKSINEIIDRYIFLPNKEYIIEVYNPNYKKFVYEDIKDLSLINAWNKCAECAEYRYITICNGEICIDHFIIDDHEFTIDLGFVYGGNEFYYGDKVKSSLLDEEFTLSFCRISNIESVELYNRNSVINSKVYQNFEFDMHYLFIDQDGYVHSKIYPVCTLHKIN